MPLQRNTTDHPLDVPAASVTVQPGGEIDFPLPIAGFEPVDEPEPDESGDQEQGEQDTGAEPEPAPPKTTRKRAATRPASEEAAG
jgi:hypothetical protein